MRPTINTTIKETMDGFRLVDPWARKTLSFNTLLQAVSYCREAGLSWTMADNTHAIA